MIVRCKKCGKPVPKENYETEDQVFALCRKHTKEWFGSILFDIHQSKTKKKRG